MKTYNEGVRQEKIEGKHGKIYRASGNLLIVKSVAKTTAYSNAATRDNITKFSASSGRRMRQYLRECVAEYKYMVTLTYPFCYPTNGRDTKEHLRRFLQELRREYARYAASERLPDNFSCFWFLEFQERGAPHYHLFTTWCPNNKWVSRRWYEICGSEDERHLHAGTRCELLRQGRSATISYASKYANKQAQKDVPEGFSDVGRFWGVVGMKFTVSAATFVSARAELEPAVIKAKKKLKDLIKELLNKKQADIIIKNDDTFVLSVNNKFAVLKVRLAVSELMGATMTYSNMFIDADIRELEFWGDKSYA